MMSNSNAIINCTCGFPENHLENCKVYLDLNQIEILDKIVSNRANLSMFTDRSKEKELLQLVVQFVCSIKNNNSITDPLQIILSMLGYD